MKIVKVSYTVKHEYASQNQINIKKVMADLQKLNRAGINYNVCLSADGKTFIHTAFMQTEEDNKTLLDLPSFKHFQEQLKAEGIETPPKQELLTLVESSTPVFRD